MSRVFTIFNHGTDFHRDKDRDEAVTLLHDAIAGNEARIIQAPVTKHNPSGFRLEAKTPTYLVCEGPGSDTIAPGTTTRGVGHSHPGQDNPLLNLSKDLKQNPFAPKRTVPARDSFIPFMSRGAYEEVEPMSQFRKDFVGQTPSNSQTSGRVFGTGWDDNVYKAAWTLTHLKFERGMNIQTVNLMGWSRGAVTCIRQANKLYEVFGTSLKVNIFAIDPVPGGLTSVTDDMRLIPPNVQHMLVILALDDDRSNFQPLDADSMFVSCPATGTVEAPAVHYLPLPGNHSDVVYPTKGNAPQSGKLVVHLAHKFLHAHGTRFSHPPRHGSLTVPQILEAYEALQANRELTIKNAASAWNDFVGGFRRKERPVRISINAYTQDPHRWLNEHHRQCALAPDLAATARPPISIGPGQPYRPWQGLLHQMGIAYATAPVARTLRRA